ncbi:hypothetical protein CEP51_011242 [Fusarium floridanum]|uniref:Uncharacterized protein n=1 Tax=Fusarium floridanum TaxID=1325733 RepID=A0A428RBX4_9HYPO|nr:hypothetical protein CEP51_011242 [Fusarium floridanum]
MPKDAKRKGKSRMADLSALKITGVAAGLDKPSASIRMRPYIGIRTRSSILTWHVPEQLADAFLIGIYPHRLDAIEKQGHSTPAYPSPKSDPMQT